MEDKIRKQVRTLGYVTTDHLALLNYGEVNNSNRERCAKMLRKLVELEELDVLTLQPKGKLYRLKGLKGEGGQHCLVVASVLVEIMRSFPKSIIEREPKLDLPRRPDAALIIRRASSCLPFLLEVAVAENKDSLRNKIEDYYRWKGGWFKERGAKCAGILVVGEVGEEISQMDGVKVIPEFKKEILYGLL